MKDTRTFFVFVILLVLLAVSAVLSLSIGSISIPFGKVVAVLAGKGGTASEINIIMQIRLPRLVMAFLLGGALSLSGFLLQTYFQNPIAGPFVLGISSGAKMTVAIAMIFFLQRGIYVGSVGLVLAAFLGAILSTSFILLVSKKISSIDSIFSAVALVFFPFLLTGRTFVFRVDGESQYIVYLRYMGQYLRETVRNFLQGSFTLKMYDFTIGMGDDINAIVRFHPLDFLSVFVPEEKTEALYVLILLLRYYLSGLSFSLYALSFGRGERAGREKRLNPVNVLSGALVYVFGGFMLIRVMNHPIYASAFIFLPLLLLSAERVSDGKGQLLFPLTVALSFISNYYYSTNVIIFLKFLYHRL